MRTRIAVSAGQPEEALRHADEGLRLARDCGFGIYHIDLQNTIAESHLLAGRPAEAERAARTALHGSGDGDDATPPEKRGLFPPPETGQPVLLARHPPGMPLRLGRG